MSGWLLCLGGWPRAVSADIAVMVTTLAGETLAGVIDSQARTADVGGGILITGSESSVSFEDILQVEFQARAGDVTARERRWAVVFSTGDVVFVDGVAAADEFWIFTRQEAAAVVWRAPLGEVVAVVAAGDADRFRQLPSPQVASDVVRLRNGDEINGEFRSWSTDGLSCATSLGPVIVATSDVRQLNLNAALMETPEYPGDWWAVWLRDGSRLSCARIEPVPAGWRLTLLEGQTLQLAAGELKRWERRGDRVFPLAETPPLSIRAWSAFGDPVDWLLHRGPGGELLRVESLGAVRGWRAVGAGRLECSVPPNAELLVCRYAFEQGSGPLGSVNIRIELDGREAWRRDHWTSAAGLETAPPVSLRGVRQISLVVEHGARADVQDVLVWIDPVCIMPR